MNIRQQAENGEDKAAQSQAVTVDIPDQVPSYHASYRSRRKRSNYEVVKYTHRQVAIQTDDRVISNQATEIDAFFTKV